jgi:hypothetical protein
MIFMNTREERVKAQDDRTGRLQSLAKAPTAQSGPPKRGKDAHVLLMHRPAPLQQHETHTHTRRKHTDSEAVRLCPPEYSRRSVTTIDKRKSAQHAVCINTYIRGSLQFSSDGATGDGEVTRMQGSTRERLGWLVSWIDSSSTIVGQTQPLNPGSHWYSPCTHMPWSHLSHVGTLQSEPTKHSHSPLSLPHSP